MSLIDAANSIEGDVQKIDGNQFWVVHYDEATNTATLSNGDDTVKGRRYTAEELEFIGRSMSPCPEHLIIDCILPEDCTALFCGMEHLKRVSLGDNFDSSHVINMCCMFAECCELEEFDASHWDTSHVHNLSYVFKGCEKLYKLDLSTWDVKSVQNLTRLFYRCIHLTELNISSWEVNTESWTDDMFGMCGALRRKTLPRWAVKIINFDALT